MLRDYLDAFTTACQRSSERIYIDAFAGEDENEDRLTGELIAGSPRVAWNDQYGPEWIRTPFARLGYVQKQREWTLYWADRNSKFHRYELAESTSNIGLLLAEIDADPTNIFWG